MLNAAQAMGLQLTPAEFQPRWGWKMHLLQSTRRPCRRFVVLTDPILFSQRKRTVDLASSHGCRRCTFPRLCRGRRLDELWPKRCRPVSPRRGLCRQDPEGRKPGDLPIEQPTSSSCFINLKTANTLGLRIPESFLVRADKVIE